MARPVNLSLYHGAGVYKVFSTLDPSRAYYGSTSRYQHRVFTHLRELRYRRHFNSRLQGICNRYGIATMVVQLLIKAEPCFMRIYEQKLIDRNKATVLNNRQPISKGDK